MKSKIPLFAALQRLQKITTKSTGLFGNPVLSTQDGFKKLTIDVENKACKLVDQIINKTGPKDRPTVALVDDLSNVICSAADLSMKIFTNLVETLNTSTALLNALKESLITERHLLDDTDKRTIDLFIHDFEQCDVHLPDKEKKEFVSLSNEVFHYASIFSRNTEKPSMFTEEEQKKYGIGPLVDTPYPHVADPELRKLFFNRFYQHSDEQEHALRGLIGTRHMLANLTGYKSFAHRVQPFSLLGTYENTLKFLEGIIQSFSNTVEPELNLVKEAFHGQKVELNPISEWDYSYGSSLYRQRLFGFTGLLSKYFHFETILCGFEMIVKKLYGIRFESSLPADGEIWDGKVIKINVIDENSNLLGTIYIDLEDRETKLTGDCHYTVRCSKQLENGEFQTPIVVLSLDACDSDTEIENLTLSPHMAETFFHEMGHAIHSMLGRTRYQHTAGTRCPTDMAEVPSNLMEFFFNDMRILKLICKDSSGRSIRDDEAEALIASRSLFSGIETLQQTHYALFDLLAHGPEYAPMIANGKITTTELFAKIGKKALPQTGRGENVAWPQRFSHIGPYGAKYYSYLVAKAAASLIWEKCFREDPFSRKRGLAWAKVQSYGGELPSSDLLEIALQKAPTATDLCQALHSNYSRNMELIKDSSSKM
uniref:Peptidase M3A/M3B catalytic domain-containing protein n=1 Tax=Panagrolaimus sp. PS1159 TaxID=55785 RepID=A0AC35ESC7_9BILA